MGLTGPPPATWGMDLGLRVVVEAEVTMCAVDVGIEVEAFDAEVDGSSVRADEDEDACARGMSSPMTSTSILSAPRPPTPCPSSARGATRFIARMMQACSPSSPRPSSSVPSSRSFSLSLPLPSSFAGRTCKEAAGQGQQVQRVRAITPRSHGKILDWRAVDESSWKDRDKEVKKKGTIPKAIRKLKEEISTRSAPISPSSMPRAQRHAPWRDGARIARKERARRRWRSGVEGISLSMGTYCVRSSSRSSMVANGGQASTVLARLPETGRRRPADVDCREHLRAEPALPLLEHALLRDREVGSTGPSPAHIARNRKPIDPHRQRIWSPPCRPSPPPIPMGAVEVVDVVNYRHARSLGSCCANNAEAEGTSRLRLRSTSSVGRAKFLKLSSKKWTSHSEDSRAGLPGKSGLGGGTPGPARRLVVLEAAAPTMTMRRWLSMTRRRAGGATVASEKPVDAEHGESAESGCSRRRRRRAYGGRQVRVPGQQNACTGGGRLAGVDGRASYTLRARRMGNERRLLGTRRVLQAWHGSSSAGSALLIIVQSAPAIRDWGARSRCARALARIRVRLREKQSKCAPLNAKHLNVNDCPTLFGHRRNAAGTEVAKKRSDAPGGRTNKPLSSKPWRDSTSFVQFVPGLTICMGLGGGSGATKEMSQTERKLTPLKRLVWNEDWVEECVAAHGDKFDRIVPKNARKTIASFLGRDRYTPPPPEGNERDTDAFHLAEILQPAAAIASAVNGGREFECTSGIYNDGVVGCSFYRFWDPKTVYIVSRPKNCATSIGVALSRSWKYGLAKATPDVSVLNKRDGKLWQPTQTPGPRTLHVYQDARGPFAAAK
ncbi:hypothetical protein GGX14DRAFT_393398 [Mycena pura]|uniref:Uncharacterized protein n=1 Tax=Mycena pura TaxID=153505 RepID=A0AAD6VP03_9AGAR|nr:hypothetical protein GGX14DRAFT_393398 [Mycena pura]